MLEKKLFVRLRLLVSLHSHALLILAKSSKSKCQLVHQQKWSYVFLYFNTYQFSSVRRESEENTSGSQFYFM